MKNKKSKKIFLMFGATNSIAAALFMFEFRWLTISSIALILALICIKIYIENE